MKSKTAHCAIVVCGLLGLADATLLYYWHATSPFVNPAWDSPYGYFFWLPVSVWGIAVYTAILLLAYFGRYDIIGLVSAIATAFSVYLIWASVFIIKHVCPYCVFSALMMGAIFCVSFFTFPSREKEKKS